MRVFATRAFCARRHGTCCCAYLPSRAHLARCARVAIVVVLASRAPCARSCWGLIPAGFTHRATTPISRCAWIRCRSFRGARRTHCGRVVVVVILASGTGDALVQTLGDRAFVGVLASIACCAGGHPRNGTDSASCTDGTIGRRIPVSVDPPNRACNARQSVCRRVRPGPARHASQKHASDGTSLPSRTCFANVYVDVGLVLSGKTVSTSSIFVRLSVVTGTTALSSRTAGRVSVRSFARAARARLRGRDSVRLIGTVGTTCGPRAHAVDVLCRD